MSGRAVRKALRQREAALAQQEAATNDDDVKSAQTDDEEEQPAPAKQSLFALLANNDESENGTDENDNSPDETSVTVEKPSPASKSSKKKKKKKGKGKGRETAVKADTKDYSEHLIEDEIESALRAVRLQDAVEKHLSEFLKVESKNLDSANEMKRLFGRAALTAEGNEGTGAQGDRRRGGGRRGGAQMGSRGYMGRRNTFVRPKEGWPTGGSGGLGMEIEHTDAYGLTMFKFMHAPAYQSTQREFIQGVAMMDPDRLIVMLQHYPYHIAVLLQTSEIFAHQRDHTISGDLLERAFFTFGRSLHSNFPAKMSEGKARLDFRRPENREFWLLCWRYIGNLGMRGTWRTAEEVGRLLLAMDPEGDPYMMCLLIDFLALKARQPEHLLSLAGHPQLEGKYSKLPNMAYSRALAYHQLGQKSLSKEHLEKAITKFPWIVPRLFSELCIDHKLPPVLWAAQPPEDDRRQKLLCELYIVRAKDLWKEPDASQFLIDVASTIYNLPKTSLLHYKFDVNDVPESVEGISVAIARHVIATDIPAVTALLPRALIQGRFMAYDPLPPKDSIVSYNTDIAQAPQVSNDGTGAVIPNTSIARSFIRSLLPWIRGDGGEPLAGGIGMPSEEELDSIRDLLVQQGVNIYDLTQDDDTMLGEVIQGIMDETEEVDDHGDRRVEIGDDRRHISGVEIESESDEDAPRRG
ncbi:hypothetical protein RUND412_003148 [Rhizina undulata]